MKDILQTNRIWFNRSKLPAWIGFLVVISAFVVSVIVQNTISTEVKKSLSKFASANSIDSIDFEFPSKVGGKTDSMKADRQDIVAIWTAVPQERQPSTKEKKTYDVTVDAKVHETDGTWLYFSFFIDVGPGLVNVSFSDGFGNVPFSIHDDNSVLLEIARKYVAVP